MDYRSRFFAFALSLFALVCAFIEARADHPAESRPERYNVLLICIDDLRCNELGYYGQKMIQTPNIDRLARQGRPFMRHYVPIAACGPSRSSMLSGMRTLDWDYTAGLRRQLQQNPQLEPPAQPVSMADCFRRNGYRTISIGKVSHQPNGCMDDDMKTPQIPFSWDRAYSIHGKWGGGEKAMFGYADGSAFNKVAVRDGSKEPRLPYEAADVADDGYVDALNAAEAVEQLRALAADGERPFFLAVGFVRPHLPFNSPRRYWELYEGDKIPPAPWREKPRNVEANFTLHNSYEPTTHYHWPSGAGNVSEAEGRTLKHAYWAATSYMDAQVGKVLEEYRRLGLDRNTVIVLWSDHGWHLGEHGIWGKYTTHEVSLRSPFIIQTPNMPQPGAPANGLVETIDLYPTLAGICGLQAPETLQGVDLTPMLQDPAKEVKHAAIGQVPRGAVMGTSLRTDRYRMTRWQDQQTGEIRAIELYDHQTDPDETTNVAADRRELVDELLEQLNAALE